MQCSSKTCGYYITPKIAGDRKVCNICGSALRYDAEDYLRYGVNSLVTESRPGQVQMARLVGDALNKHQILLVEGPVGSGKSLAYSLPAILEGKRVVISTAKKQLQHQLADKDIPAIKESTGSLVHIGMIKGKGNYACQYKINNAGTDIPQSDYRKLVGWLASSPTGDLSDYPGERPVFWGSITAEDCVGQRCKLRKDCGYWTEKINARTANVIIANHNMVAFDLKFGPGKLLGNYDALVLDEAHQAEEAFRGAYTETVHQFGYRRLLRLMDAAGSVTGYEKQLDALWPKMFAKLKHQEGKIEKDPFGEEGNEVSILLGAIIKDAVSNMHKLGFKGTAEGNTEDYASANTKMSGNDDVAKFEMVKSMATRLYTSIDASKDPHENSVIYITESGAKRYKSVNVAPINMGPLIGPKLRALKSVIITSATMAVGTDFSDIRKKLGVDYSGPGLPLANTQTDLDEPKEVITAVLPSPFNYAEQAALYVPKHMPLPVTSSDPGLPAYYDKLTVEIKRLIEASNGNTFVLFTSNSDLKAIHLRLVQANLKNPLIIQGDDAEAALNLYRTTPNSVLLGSKSFWEGVDVVGNKLRLVIITKLPFPMMTDPILQGKMKQLTEQLAATGANAAAITGQVFNALQVPKMITDLRQGAGRLIRSKTDMGVLAILDPRVWTGSGKKTPSPTQQNHLGYGAQVINAIGFVNRVSVFDKIKTFLEQLSQRPD